MNALKVSNSITLADRLAHGFLTIDEVAALKLCGKSQVYLDIRAGILKITKTGRLTRIAGPDAVAYVPGSHRTEGKAA